MSIFIWACTSKGLERLVLVPAHAPCPPSGREPDLEDLRGLVVEARMEDGEDLRQEIERVARERDEARAALAKMQEEDRDATAVERARCVADLRAARERDMLKALCLEAAERFGTGKRALSPYGFIGRAEDERTDLVNRLRAAGGKT